MQLRNLTTFEKLDIANVLPLLVLVPLKPENSSFLLLLFVLKHKNKYEN